MLTGGLPSLHTTDAPISFNGSETRSIGLFIKDSSPTNVALRFKLEIKPIINLMPVPEFPKSTSLSGFLNGISLLFIVTDVPWIVIDDPIALRAFAVEIGSSPFKKPLIAISSFNNEPNITALCDIDLSPGHKTSPEINWLC